jgi:hypothetical protein
MHFADRKDLLEHFRNSVIKSTKTKLPRPDNIAVLGDWGIGKTSMVVKFEDIILNEFKGRLKVLSVRIQLKPASCTDMDVFSEALVREIKSAYRINDTSITKKIKNFLDKWEVNTIEIYSTVRIEKKKETQIRIDLTKTLENLWKNLKNHIDLVVIMFDDLHYLLQGYPDGLFDIRSTFQDLVTKGCNYMLIVTGPKILYQEVGDIAEPLTRFFDPFFLNSFGLEGTKEAILKPIKIEKVPVEVKNEVIEKIHSITLGHPYFIAFIMQDLLDKVEKGAIIDLDMFDKLYPKIIERVNTAKFKTDFDKISDKEREVLIKISKIRRELVTPSDIGKTHAEIISRLVSKGLLIKESRGQYRIYHPLFKRFLLTIQQRS